MNQELNNGLINKVLNHFECSLSDSKISPLGNGLINHTYLVKSPNQTFVLQKINNYVFKNPLSVIENADLINNHLIEQVALSKYPLNTIGQLKTINAESFAIVDGEYWRAIQFIPNCYTVESVENVTQAKQAATAFAQFSCSLSNFDAKRLHEIIPDFHNLSFRISQLETAKAADQRGRLNSCRELVDYCLSQSSFIEEVVHISQKLPLQVTHNDTKINNLLFDSKTNEPTAVIDLDTCMPGYLMNDFGDMVRTCCSNLPEDGENINEMEIRFDIFEALAQGYLETFADVMSEDEKHSLVIGAQLFPFMVGIRFLTDYLEGDQYFHTSHPTHNLLRAKNQVALFTLLNKNRARLKDLVFQNELVNS